MTASSTLPTGYDLYEIAYLAGGVRRAVHTAVVAMLEEGRLRATPLTGELHVVDQHRRHPVEAAVLDAIGPRGGRSIDTVRWRAGSDERLEALAHPLERDGLMHPPDRLHRLRRRYWEEVALTRAGRRVLRELRCDPPLHRAPGSPSAVPVALYGPSRMADRELRTAIFEPPRPQPRPQRSELLAARRAREAGLDLYPRSTSAWFGADGGGGFGGGGFDCGGGGGDGGGC